MFCTVILSASDSLSAIVYCIEYIEAAVSVM